MMPRTVIERIRKSPRRLLLTALGCLLLASSAGAQPYVYKLKKWDIPAANYSGITPLGGDTYAVVSDEEAQAGFHLWTLRFSPQDGTLQHAAYEGWRGVPWPEDRDAEGIAYCPQRGTLMVSGETDQRILEHRLDGTPTGQELPIPSTMRADRIQPNRGFEALGYDTSDEKFWTTTESPLPSDEPLQLRLIAFDSQLRLCQEVPYMLEAPRARNAGRDHYHGVVAITPLGDGRLLILEREARIATHYSGSRCWCQLFAFDPRTGQKERVDAWSTRFTLANTRMANYEGMCLGPRLQDGRQTVLLVSDSQAGYGAALWHLKDYLRVVVL